MSHNEQTPAGSMDEPYSDQFGDRSIQSEGVSIVESDPMVTQYETPPTKSVDSTDVGAKVPTAKAETKPTAKAETHRETDSSAHDEVTAETQVETPSSRTTKVTVSR
jgi:hypothetical protein